MSKRVAIEAAAAKLSELARTSKAELDKAGGRVAEATRKANRCAGSACDLWRRLAHVVVALVGSIALRNGQTTYDGEMGQRRQLGLCQSPLSRNAQSAKPLTRGNCRTQD